MAKSPDCYKASVFNHHRAYRLGEPTTRLTELLWLPPLSEQASQSHPARTQVADHHYRLVMAFRLPSERCDPIPERVSYPQEF